MGIFSQKHLVTLTSREKRKKRVRYLKMPSFITVCTYKLHSYTKDTMIRFNTKNDTCKVFCLPCGEMIPGSRCDTSCSKKYGERYH
jgi:hypothetical protein